VTTHSVPFFVKTRSCNTQSILSKIEARKLELNPQTVQLAPLINEVIG
jgi:hypothetical protein